MKTEEKRNEMEQGRVQRRERNKELFSLLITFKDAVGYFEGIEGGKNKKENI